MLFFLVLLGFASLRLQLPLLVVLRQVAVLAHTLGVVGSFGVSALFGLLGLTNSMVAVIAHVLGIVFSVFMWTVQNLLSLSLEWALIKHIQEIWIVLEFFTVSRSLFESLSKASLGPDSNLTWN